MYPTRLTACVAGATLSLVALLAPASDWPQWRGPAFNGSSAETGLPSSFDKTENVLWSCPMPGPSGATPVISGDHVFVASTDEQTRTCVAIAIDRKTGKVLWQHKVADGYGKDSRSTYSNSSPVTDGRHAWFFYATGDLICFDLAGKEIWHRNIQKEYGQFAFLWTFASTPLLWDGKLYLQVLQRDEPVQGRGQQDAPSFLLALNPTTGQELWKVIRPGDAKAESREAFTTPIPASVDGRSELLVVGGDCLTGHDPATGKELWRWGTWNPTRIGHWRLVPSPVVGGGVALVCAPKGAPVYAVKLGGQGELSSADLAWQSAVQSAEDPAEAARSLDNRDLTSDVPTPLFYEGRFYVLNGDRRKLVCVEPSGKIVWTGDLPGRAIFQASPTGADGKIYLMNFAGDVFVVQAGGTEFKLLHTAAMGDNENTLRASIPISHGQLFIRTSKHLYCLGRK
jgi:outer membrane protein assembly factor BamB